MTRTALREAGCGYQVVYEIIEEKREVHVLWIDHRADVYRRR